MTNTPNNGQDRAPVQAGVTVFMGLDVHAAQITVSRQVDGRLPQPSHRRDESQLLELVAEYIRNGAKVYTCYEAGPCGYGLHRQLVALGAVNFVVAPRRWDPARRVKTDKRDARELCVRLDQYVRGHHDAFSIVRVPTPEQERRRALCRQRETFLKERQRCELRGRGLALAQGIRAPLGWWEPKVWPDFAATLPAWLRDLVQPWQKDAVRLQAEVEALTPRIECLSTGQVIPKGLGAMTAAQIDAEVLDWSRFGNRRAPGSYTGLCPTEDSTGQSRKQGSVSKHGNPRLRHWLVEAIWRMLAHQPDYPPLRAVRAATSSRAKKRAVVAAARQLAVDLWRIRTQRCTPEQRGLRV